MRTVVGSESVIGCLDDAISECDRGRRTKIELARKRRASARLDEGPRPGARGKPTRGHMIASGDRTDTTIGVVRAEPRKSGGVILEMSTPAVEASSTHSVADREASTSVTWIFDLVEDRDGEVLEGDPRAPLRVDDEHVSAETIRAAPLPGLEPSRRAHVGPREIVGLDAYGVLVGARLGDRAPRGGNDRLVVEGEPLLLAGHPQARRATDEHEPLAEAPQALRERERGLDELGLSTYRRTGRTDDDVVPVGMAPHVVGS